MKRRSPIRIPRVFRHGPSLLDSSPTKFLPPASSGTLFTTFFRHSQLCDPSCQLLCSAARPQHTSTPPLHSIQFAYGPRPPQSRAASFKSLYRKRANTPCSCRCLAPSRFRYNTRTSRQPARTSVSSSRTFVPLLTTEGLCILLPESFQREQTSLMKLGIFILLPLNERPCGVSHVRGVEKSATPFDGGI